MTRVDWKKSAIVFLTLSNDVVSSMLSSKWFLSCPLTEIVTELTTDAILMSSLILGELSHTPEWSATTECSA
eukprot:747765-Amphidinium_carterae.1